MRYNELGRAGLKASELCLGSMTWGSQNSEAEGHAQIDMATARGINIIDTAEMYPSMPGPNEMWGDTEAVLGSWIAKNKARRGDVLVATKVSGEGHMRIRDGAPISPETIREALEGSLRRLQTDYVDIYQLHWPNRGSYMFRQNWTYDPTGQDTQAVSDNMAAVLECLAGFVAEGKIRHIGLSNESAWGTAKWLQLAEQTGGPRVVSMQNEYSLLCRLYDTDMAELSHHEAVGLLAFSPLATGLISGKYSDGAAPEGSRLAYKNGSKNLGGRLTERALLAADVYVNIAREHGLDPCQMALAWCRTRPFMASAIFGASTLEQLDMALGSVDVTLSEEVLSAIDTAHRAHPMPY